MRIVNLVVDIFLRSVDYIVALSVKDGVNGQAHIGLTFPSAEFRGGDFASIGMLPR